MAMWGEKNSMALLRRKKTYLTGRIFPHVLLLNLKAHAVTSAFHGCCLGMGVSTLSTQLLSCTERSEQGRTYSQCHKRPEWMVH